MCQGKRYFETCSQCKYKVKLAANRESKRKKKLEKGEDSAACSSLGIKQPEKTNQRKSYKHLLCSKCQGKTLKNSCKECQKKNSRSRDKEYRRKNSHDKEYRRKKKLRDAKYRNKKKLRDANSDNAKNKNPKHADHRDQILQKSKVKSKNKENKPNKFSDTGTAKTKKVYANKTKANAATKIKKVFGSPNKRKQMLEYLAERDIIPELNNQIRNEKVGEFFTSLKEDSPKNPVTYQMLGKLQGKISVPNALSARKLFHLSHKKSKEFLSDKPISRKVRKNKIPEKVKSKVKDFFNRCDIVFINPSKPYKYMRLCFRDAYQ